MESSKVAYDLPKGKALNDENYKNLSKFEDKVYVDKISAQLERVKKNYNVNSQGRYNGGVPRERGLGRGNSLGETGEFHDPELQRAFEGNDIGTDFIVNRQDVVEYGRYMTDDREQYGITRTWLRAKIDPEYFSFKKYSATIKFVAFFFFLQIAMIYVKTIRKALVSLRLRSLKSKGLLPDSGVVYLK
jgi:hypothetical protein